VSAPADLRKYILYFQLPITITEFKPEEPKPAAPAPAQQQQQSKFTLLQFDSVGKRMYSICHTYNSHMYIHTRSFGRGVFTRGPSGRMLEKFSILRGTTTFNAPVMKLSGCDCIGAKLIT